MKSKPPAPAKKIAPKKKMAVSPHYKRPARVKKASPRGSIDLARLRGGKLTSSEIDHAADLLKEATALRSSNLPLPH